MPAADKDNREREEARGVAAPEFAFPDRKRLSLLCLRGSVPPRWDLRAQVPAGRTAFDEIKAHRCKTDLARRPETLFAPAVFWR